MLPLLTKIVNAQDDDDDDDDEDIEDDSIIDKRLRSLAKTKKLSGLKKNAKRLKQFLTKTKRRFQPEEDPYP